LSYDSLAQGVQADLYSSLYILNKHWFGALIVHLLALGKESHYNSRIMSNRMFPSQCLPFQQLVIVSEELDGSMSKSSCLFTDWMCDDGGLSGACLFT
jgi:hypothetical protein